LVDGGLVNAVPVSLARAMGADIVIAVNLNGDLVGHHFFVRALEKEADETPPAQTLAASEEKDSVLARWSASMKTGLGVRLGSYIASLRTKAGPEPGLFDVIVGSIDIMQDRITRSRMAGEPPDIHITPRLSSIGLLDFDRADESIEEGRQATQRQREELEPLAQSLRLDSGPATY
jgi:NTE family protein